MVGFYKDGSGWIFAWGLDLEKRLDAAKPGSPDIVVFERLKTCFLAPDEAEEFIVGVERRLRGIMGEDKEIHWLHQLYLSRIRVAALDAAKHLFRHSFTSEQIDAIEKLDLFAVHELSTPSTNRALMKAAKEAGFQRPLPVSETEAAGARGVHLYLEYQDADAPIFAKCQVRAAPGICTSAVADFGREGDEILVGDGGGTIYVRTTLPLMNVIHRR